MGGRRSLRDDGDDAEDGDVEVTAPRAVGRRASYAAMPARVTAWVESTLGSPVVEHRDQVGGFSPGCAARLVCADGTRAFVKAVGAELNPDTPTLFRREVLALTLLGSDPLWADLLASYDSAVDGGPEGGDWVALLLEDVDGAHPDLADDATMAALLEATDELVARVGHRVPERPGASSSGDDATAPIYRAGLVDLGGVWTSLASTFDLVDELPGGAVPQWLLEHHESLAEGVRRLVDVPATQLVHYDIRNDNLLQRPDGSIVFVDWGAAGWGPDWLDPLLARLERVDSPWFDASLAGSAALTRVGDATVTSWLVGMGAYLAYRAHTAPVVGLPTLDEFRRRESARFLDGAGRRLGFGR